ncbi:MAG: hypothetical protein ACR2OU_16580 [Thermomicrobiales bacterium]
MKNELPNHPLPAVGPMSRRKAVAAAVTGISVAALGGATAWAQSATPGASPVTTNGQVAYLFVQAGFTAGSLKPNGDGTYLLTLVDAPEQTIYFSDRPDRFVGTMPTVQFLKTLGFDLSDPPNAALVMVQDDGSTDTAVLELSDPVYDAAKASLTYQATILEERETLKASHAGFAEAPLNADQVPPTFGASSLFIDSLLGCSPWDPRC